MNEVIILKNILSKKFYKEHKTKLKPTLFNNEYLHLFRMIQDAHKKYSHDLTTDEIFALFKANNPVLTSSNLGIVEGIINEMDVRASISDEVASDVIHKLYVSELGKEYANLGIELSEGNLDVLPRLKALSERISGEVVADEFGDPTTSDLAVLLEETSTDNAYSFNIRTLRNVFYGLPKATLGICFATPESGKTAMVISLCCSPEGFCHQGAKVLYLGNEEKTVRTNLRAFSSCSGMTREEIKNSPDVAIQRYDAIADNLIMKDIQDWDLNKIESYIENVQPNIVVLDQADKVMIGGNYSASHERLRELYRSLRETAKKFDCAIICVGQASAEAEGRTRLSYTMQEGSKIGKAAEADWILGIGRHSGESADDEGADTVRFLTISKNKITGWHGTIICNIQPEISRYVE